MVDDVDPPSEFDRALVTWAESEDGQELIAKFRGRVSLNGLYKRMKEFSEAIESAQGSYSDMLEAHLYANYFMLESVLGTREKLAEYNRMNMSNYLTVKKGYLKLIYVCVMYSGYENAESLA